MTKISTLLDQIDSGTLLLPEFQRGFVWRRQQICRLIRSLYLGYPVGSLLVWETGSESTPLRGGGGNGARSLLLDGQQRITSLYGVVRGSPPRFFDGDGSIFDGLRFNTQDEQFSFTPHKKSAGDFWVDVTRVINDGAGFYLQELQKRQDLASLYLNRLNRLAQIVDREVPKEKITSEEHDIESVVDIFNQVNSAGTPLSKGDLALARMCARVPKARQTVRGCVEELARAGIRMRPDLHLRNVTAVSGGRVTFASLDDVPASDFEAALTAAPQYVKNFLEVLASRLGIDHDRVLLGRTAMPMVCALLHLSGGEFSSVEHRDKTLYWYLLAAVFGRYATSTETMLNRDLAMLEEKRLDGVIAELQRWIDGPVEITPDHFQGGSSRTPAYPLIYILTRTQPARDLRTGRGLTRDEVPRPLVAQEIFPKKHLRKVGLPHNYVNAVANYCVVPPEVSKELRGSDLRDRLGGIEEARPGTLTSHCIPPDPDLWEIGRYPDFLDARRVLLAESATRLCKALVAKNRMVNGASNGRKPLKPRTR